MDILGLIQLIYDYEINLYKEIKTKSIFKPKNKEELKKVINSYCYNYYMRIINDCIIHPLNKDRINNIRKLYGDMSVWDVSNVIDISYMFACAEYDYDISDWNVSNVTNMNNMFSDNIFKGDISNWDVSKVIDMSWIVLYE